MNYLIDTCVLSEYVKKSPDNLVIEWLNQQFNNFLTKKEAQNCTSFFKSQNYFVQQNNFPLAL